MTRSQAGFWLLVLGVLMFVAVRSYVNYKGYAGFSLLFKRDWLTQWQDIAAVFGLLGLLLLWPVASPYLRRALQ